MEAVSTQIQIIAVIAVIGALIETFLPGFFSEKAKSLFTLTTIVIIGVLLSFLLLMWFLKLRVREGFEDNSYLSRWKRLMEENRVSEVCDVYNEIYEKLYTVEKGAPPLEVKTDAQAREAVDAKFAKLMTVKTVSCKDIQELNESNRLDTFYENITKIPQNIFIQVYQTAIASRALLKETYENIQNSEEKAKDKAANLSEEGFEDLSDKPLCEDKAAVERKAYLERKPLSPEAEKCLLAEEVPPEQKEKVITTRLNQIESSFEDYKKSIKDSITKVLEDCKRYKTEMERKKKETEAKFDKFKGASLSQRT